MKGTFTKTRAILTICALIASIATAGSLYFSEVVGLYPCDLCWMQRIAMYPLVVVFAVAAFEDRLTAWRTAIPLSVGGGLVAAYHSHVQRTPSSSCSVGSGCEQVQFELFGLLSIPNLSLLAFTIVIAVLVAGVVSNRD